VTALRCTKQADTPQLAHRSLLPVALGRVQLMKISRRAVRACHVRHRNLRGGPRLQRPAAGFGGGPLDLARMVTIGAGPRAVIWSLR